MSVKSAPIDFSGRDKKSDVPDDKSFSNLFAKEARKKFGTKSNDSFEFKTERMLTLEEIKEDDKQNTPTSVQNSFQAAFKRIIIYFHLDDHYACR